MTIAKANQEVNCPIHGTHGNLSQGKCWWCVQAGNSTSPNVGVTRKIGFQSSVGITARIPGTVRVIK